MVGSTVVCSLALARSDRARFWPDRAGVRLAGRTDERVRRYSAGGGVAAGCCLSGAAGAAGFGAGFAGFGGGYVVQK